MIVSTTDNGITTVAPAPGKYITNGETYADSMVYLGKLDSPENWTEVDEIPPEPEPEPIDEMEPAPDA